QYAQSIAATDPAETTVVNQQVLNAGLPELAKAYADAGGDAGTSAGGGGGGQGPTAIGPPTGGANTGGIVGGSTFVGTTATGLISLGLGGGGCVNCGGSPSSR